MLSAPAESRLRPSAGSAWSGRAPSSPATKGSRS